MGTSTSKPKSHKTLSQKMQARYTGMKANLANIPGPLYCNGKSYTPTALLAEGDGYVQELSGVDAAKANYQSKADAAKADHPKIEQYLSDSEEVMKQVLGTTNPALASMDITVATARKPAKPSAKRAVKSVQIRQNKANLKAQNEAVRQATGQAVVDMATGSVVSLIPAATGASTNTTATQAAGVPAPSPAAPAEPKS
jgi:hypothetical protein